MNESPFETIDPAPNGIVVYILGDDAEHFVAFGHHNKQQFLDAVRWLTKRLGVDDPFANWDEPVKADDVSHEYGEIFVEHDEWGVKFRDDPKFSWITRLDSES